MIDSEIKLSTIFAAIFGVAALGLTAGAWWLPYLGWPAILCGQVVLFMLLSGEHERTRSMCRVLMRSEPPTTGARPIR